MKQPTEHHPLYGEIPLVERPAFGKDGRDYPWLQYDPNYQPEPALYRDISSCGIALIGAYDNATPSMETATQSGVVGRPDTSHRKTATRS